ncbi:MAG: alpha/beta hydrolase [Kangiellaceae bacterium]|nr:alpha/beta hydrolase [Kangiellaceae bacterium]MCW9000129.1 alpha/beta hydrolase [Kangiellaceae bacterium]MCW9017550.1 alpha/beta hydrolase [Kangiellaceae bacterium]
MKVNSQQIIFEGPVGNIEAILDLPENTSQEAFISVNCHPHSLHGGTMTNKVVHTVSRAIAGVGIPSLRFNFRGVGKSAGNYDEGLGEREDLKAAIEWLANEYPNRKIILSGFSFGSFVSAFAAKDVSPSMLLSIAPPVKRFDFDGFVRPSCEWNIIMGDQDELVDFQAVLDWVNHFELTPHLINMQGASHFFHGRLVELREYVEELVCRHVERS